MVEVFSLLPLKVSADGNKDLLLATVGSARYDREMAGVMFAGMMIATDDRSKTMLNGARVKAEADPNYVTRWKVSATERLEVTASQIVAMSDLVLAFVDACFAADEVVCDEVVAGKITTEDGVRQRIADLLPANWDNG